MSCVCKKEAPAIRLAVGILLHDSPSGSVDASSQYRTCRASTVPVSGAEVVELLLADPRVDPSADNSTAFCNAASCGDIKALQAVWTDPRLLLSDDCVDPTAQDNEAVRLAASHGHSEVVRVLLADPRVDPSAHNQEAIKESSSRGHAMIVQQLLADPRVDPSADDQYAIRCARNPDTVRVLLVDQQVTQQHETTKPSALLLSHPLVGPFARDGTIMNSALHRGHDEILQLLSDHSAQVSRREVDGLQE
ncbi:hypothetical protein PROFUN_10232 [Planoprotostelium fungivorum]|uniref:Uncharacterized protein n=1 Tax=Planoprotostelium fungivorum TaxID=1890364 RepID=A0A2P6NEE3_9EUKA|nr:hypothetical protein PROFUN_10232 [Planoprotostelium fungivorum]